MFTRRPDRTAAAALCAVLIGAGAASAQVSTTAPAGDEALESLPEDEIGSLPEDVEESGDRYEQAIPGGADQPDAGVDALNERSADWGDEPVAEDLESSDNRTDVPQVDPARPGDDNGLGLDSGADGIRVGDDGALDDDGIGGGGSSLGGGSSVGGGSGGGGL